MDNIDIKLAMLGDKEAAQRLTDAGIGIPCPMCGADPYIEENWRFQIRLCCPNECAFGEFRMSRDAALLSWNTRPSILSADEISRLMEMEKGEKEIEKCD